MILKSKNRKAILFKLLVEPTSVLYCNKRYKWKYGATSLVAMTTSKQCIVVPFGKHLCNNLVASFVPFIYIKGKNAPFYF
jgi:hypothetical protein